MPRRLSKRDQIESRIETAFTPGRFIADRACFEFVRGLEEAVALVDNLLDSDSSRAATLYETVLAGCHQKAEELDDSSGSFGQFAKDLICRWIRARQKSDPDPAATATILLAWMDDDPYAFCYEIEKDVCHVLDRAGLAAFETLIRARLGAAPVPLAYDGRRWSQTLRTIYLAQKNVAAYERLAEQTGFTAQDCLALAAIFGTRKPDRALAWVERGIDLEGKNAISSSASHDLARLRRELLAKLGREEEALGAAWGEYIKHPSKYSFDDVLQFAPKAQQKMWREKALDAAKGADLHSVMDLYVETKEWERLVELVRGTTDVALENLSHYVTEPAAEKLEKNYPGPSARLWQAQALRIVDAGKSKYYDAAIASFERAKNCFERAGLAVEWERTVAEVRSSHYRKLGLMRDFEAVARGESTAQPSFLENAKAKWHGKGKA